MIALLDSGGKDSALAYELTKDIYHIDCFVTLIEHDYQDRPRVLTHNSDIPNNGNILIDVTGKVNVSENQRALVEHIATCLKALNIDVVICGIEKSCTQRHQVEADIAKQVFEENNMTLILPLYDLTTKQILEEVVRRGIQAKIIGAYGIPITYLDTIIDEDFINSYVPTEQASRPDFHTEVLNWRKP